MPLVKDTRNGGRAPPPPYSTISSTGVSPSSSPPKSFRSNSNLSGPPPSMRTRGRSGSSHPSSSRRDPGYSSNMLVLPQTVDGRPHQSTGSRSPSARRSSLGSSAPGSPGSSGRRAALYEERRRYQSSGAVSQPMTPKSSKRGLPGKEGDYIQWTPTTRSIALESMPASRDHSRPASPGQRSYYLPKSSATSRPDGSNANGRASAPGLGERDSADVPSLGFSSRPSSPRITKNNALDLFNADPRAASPTQTTDGRAPRRADKFRESRASPVGSSSRLFPDDRKSTRGDGDDPTPSQAIANAVRGGGKRGDESPSRRRALSNSAFNIMVLPMNAVRESPLSGEAIVNNAAINEDGSTVEGKDKTMEELPRPVLDKRMRTSSMGPVADDANKGDYLDFSQPAPASPGQGERRGRRKPPPVFEGDDEPGMLPPPPTTRTSSGPPPKIVTRGSSRTDVPKIKTTAPADEPKSKKSKREETGYVMGTLFGGRGAAQSVSKARRDTEPAQDRDRRRSGVRDEPPKKAAKPDSRTRKEEPPRASRKVSTKKPTLDDVKVTSEERGERAGGLFGAIFGYRAASGSAKDADARSSKLAVPGKNSEWQRFGAATPTVASSVDPDELRSVSGKSESKSEPSKAEDKVETNGKAAAETADEEEDAEEDEDAPVTVDKGKGKAKSDKAASEVDDEPDRVARRMVSKQSFASGVTGTTAEDFEDTQDWATEISGVDSRISLVDDVPQQKGAAALPNSSSAGGETSILGLVGGLGTGLYGWVTGTSSPKKGDHSRKGSVDSAATAEAKPKVNGIEHKQETAGEEPAAADSADVEADDEDVTEADKTATSTAIPAAVAAGAGAAAVAVAADASKPSESKTAAKEDGDAEAEEDAQSSLPSGKPPSYKDVAKRPSKPSRNSTQGSTSREGRRSYFIRNSKSKPETARKRTSTGDAAAAAAAAPKLDRQASNTAKSRSVPVVGKQGYVRKGPASASGRPAATPRRFSAPSFGRSAKRESPARRDSDPPGEATARPTPAKRRSAQEATIPEESEAAAKKRFSLAFWGRKPSAQATEPKEPPAPKGPNRVSVAFTNASTAAKKSATSASTAARTSATNASRAVKTTTTNAAAATGGAMKKGGTAVNDFSMRGILSMMSVSTRAAEFGSLSCANTVAFDSSPTTLSELRLRLRTRTALLVGGLSPSRTTKLPELEPSRSPDRNSGSG